MSLARLFSIHRLLAGATPFIFTLLTAAAFAGDSPSRSSDEGRSGMAHPHGGMIRYPDVSKDSITFVYANDIWIAPRTGGVATPLASPPGQEQFPKFGPDGRTISFVGNYDGNKDLFTVASAGGIPTRVTHHPDAEMLCDWTPDGKLLFYTNAFSGLRRQMQLWMVAAAGGLPEKVDVPYGANGAVSADGEWLAYTPHTTDFRTWKRYRGGMATDIWLFNLRDKSSRKMTDWEGTDTLPMWNGKTVYYLSDSGPEHRLNIWAYDTKGENEAGASRSRREQITKFADYDVKWPSIGPGPNDKGEIVFQKGAEIFLLDLETKMAHAVQISVPGARPKIRPRDFDASKNIQAREISPTGKRVFLEARGDIWSLPAQKGSPRNLTRTSGTAERDPWCSPDGRWISYFSDATGEYELYVMAADGKNEPVQVTRDSKTFYYSPMWSPDSKKIAYEDKAGDIFLATVEVDSEGKKILSTNTRKIDTEPWANQPRLSWSHDSNWIAYGKTGENRQSALWLYNVDKNEKHQVTRGFFNDTWPTFDRKGEYLFFASNRDFSKPIYEDVGTTFVYSGTDTLLCVPLRKDVKSPLAPKSDEETPTTQPADSATSQPRSAPSSAPTTTSSPASQAASQPSDKKPLVIDLVGFEQRAIPLPIKKGSFTNLVVNHEGKLLYARNLPQGVEGDPSIKIFDLADEKREEKTVFDGSNYFLISADGKKLLILKDDKIAVVDAAADQKMEKLVPMAGMNARVDPRSEWRQVFNDVWRLQRDFFYEPTLHHVDWPAMRSQYGEMLEDCTCREDLSYVIAEMISELNIGHAYYMAGSEAEETPKVSVGMLGCDYELHDGAFRIKKILHGAEWDSDARGPLSQPGVDVKEGDYLLAVNGLPLDAAKDPWAAFQGMAGQVVTITVSDKPKRDDKARDVIVECLADENALRYRNWIEHNRAKVEKATDGRVGYIYVPNTGVEGQNDLFRQFYGQMEKAALIVDERWNGGGQIPTRFIELLNRPVTNYWARRDGHDWPWPPDAHQGPKCMLINGLAGSGGDAFPAYFRQSKIGKLIGMRTWGGLVGISGNPGLIDGGNITVPTFGYYKKDGTWGIEGHGVDPDIEVVDDPAKMQKDGDPQLEAAVTLMLDEIQKNPYMPPKRPASPDRRGMGIREEDK